MLLTNGRALAFAVDDRNGGAAAGIAVARPDGDGERRQLTILFCDLVGSTALSERLDPEDLHAILCLYYETAAAAVRAFDGTVAAYLGDGIVAFFGFPCAQEDAAACAVRASLAILAGIAELNPRLEKEHGAALAVRIGVHTGPVVVGEVGGAAVHHHTAVGATTNIAARLSAAAPAGAIVTSEFAYRLVQGFFASEPIGPLVLKGISQPMMAHRILGESGAETRLDAAAVAGLTPFIGRDEEMALLRERWERVKDATGQTVVVSGEAGIGKSRLIRALRDRLAPETHLAIESCCSAHHRSSALYPVIDLLHQMLAITRDDPPERRRAKLDGLLATSHGVPQDARPLLAALLSLPPGADGPLSSMTPQRQKQRTFAALLALVRELAAAGPVILVVEDLHWVDPSTLELLETLVQGTADAAVLVILVSRPGAAPPWLDRPHVMHLTLNRMPRGQVEDLVAAVAGARQLAAPLLEQVVSLADGVPLFAEELTKMVLEAGPDAERTPIDSLGIPATLNDSLMARLDRLVPGKTVAQLAATIGRVFSFELLRAVAAVPETVLREALEQLTAAELVYQHHPAPTATYRFKHALIQDAAYRSLLRSQRRHYHECIARTLERDFPDVVEREPELLAHHYTEAGCAREAIGYWLQAGQRAFARSASEEAITHLRRGLYLGGMLDDEAARTPWELCLQTAIAAPLALRRGYGAPEVEHALTRARELAERLGDPPQRFDILRGLVGFYKIRARLEDASTAADQLVRLAAETAQPAREIEALWEQGSVAFFRGHLLDARAGLERAIALYDPIAHRSNAALYGEDPGVAAYVHAGWALWMLGYPDRAMRHVEAALAIAENLGHPNSLAMALAMAASMHQLRGEPDHAAERGAAAIRVSTEQGLPLWAAMGRIFVGWAAVQVEGGGAADEMRRGLDEWRTTGAELGLPFVHALLAEAYRAAGRGRDARELIAGALAMVERSGERYYESELHRLLGELRADEGRDDAEAELCYRRAMVVAQRHDARGLELRAALSLGTLLRAHGKKDEARSLVTAASDAITEGRDTRDLRTARRFLEETGHA